jgi:hypothetical protein
LNASSALYLKSGQVRFPAAFGRDCVQLGTFHYQFLPNNADRKVAAISEFLNQMT